MRGRLDEARKVCHTVLIASKPAKQDGIAQLWWTWAEMEWLAGKYEEALSVILRSAGIQGKGEVAVLRAKRALEDAPRRNIQWQERVAWISLGALLELLTTADAKAAVGLFDVSATKEGSVQHESLTIASLLMLYYHSVVLQNPMAPTLLRERTARAVDLYPNNSIILGIFLEGEKGQGVWGNVRASLGESGGKSKDVARRVEEVWISSWERGRWLNEIERTRSGLSAAVEHDRSVNSLIPARDHISISAVLQDKKQSCHLADIYRIRDPSERSWKSKEIAVSRNGGMPPCQRYGTVYRYNIQLSKGNRSISFSIWALEECIWLAGVGESS